LLSINLKFAVAISKDYPGWDSYNLHPIASQTGFVAKFTKDDA
jgi:hypothetical protein